MKWARVRKGEHDGGTDLRKSAPGVEAYCQARGWTIFKEYVDEGVSGSKDRRPVRKILRGFRREETIRFLAFRSHWQFDAQFCTPGEGHEKGGVEGEAGYFRRNHWVPLPQAADLDALNAQLLAGCRADEARVILHRQVPSGALPYNLASPRGSVASACGL